MIRDQHATMKYPEFINSRTQDLETIYHDSGQFYFFRVDSFLNNKQLWTDNIAGIVVSEMESQDIDTETDWKLAEMKYRLLL